MKYLRKFETEAEYEAYAISDEIVIPNVSLITENNSVKYSEDAIFYFDYLQGDGFAYLTIDYYLTNYDRVEVLSVRSTGANRSTLGARSSKMACSMTVTQNYKGYFAWRDPSSQFLGIGDVADKLPYILGMVNEDGVYKEVVIRDTNSYTLYTHDTPPEEISSDLKLRIFGCTLLDSDEINNETIYDGKIYYVKIIDSRTEEVKVHLVPAKCGVAGMYDMVNGRFYTNVNSAGSFKVYND